MSKSQDQGWPSIFLSSTLRKLNSSRICFSRLNFSRLILCSTCSLNFLRTFHLLPLEKVIPESKVGGASSTGIHSWRLPVRLPVLVPIWRNTEWVNSLHCEASLDLQAKSGFISEPPQLPEFSHYNLDKFSMSVNLLRTANWEWDGGGYLPKYTTGK